MDDEYKQKNETTESPWQLEMDPEYEQALDDEPWWFDVVVWNEGEASVVRDLEEQAKGIDGAKLAETLQPLDIATLLVLENPRYIELDKKLQLNETSLPERMSKHATRQKYGLEVTPGNSIRMLRTMGLDEFISGSLLENWILDASGDIQKAPSPDRRPVFDARLEALKQWVQLNHPAEKSYPIVLPLMREEMLQKLQAAEKENEGRSLFQMAESTFNKEFWSKQKIVKLRSGRRATQ